MSPLQRQVYRAIVRLHPRAFRHEFGREMLLDFEEAASTHTFTALCLDALLSFSRQWAISLASSDAEIVAPHTPSLLAGNYVVIRDRSLSAMEWTRGLLVSIAILASCAFMFTAGPHTPASVGVVYAAMQVIANPQDSAASPDTASTHPQFAQFDVASVREDRGSGRPYVNFPLGSNDAYAPTHGLLQAFDLPLPAYVQFAYRLDALQVVALQKQLPDWALSARYDIEARAEGDPSKDDMRLMVRALLASRFQLQLHAETTTGNVYKLEILHPGKLGPSLHFHAADDLDCRNSPPSASSAPCGRIGFSVPDPAKRTVRMAGRNVSLDQLLFYATTQMGRPVLNQTGLPGKYDFTLEYAQQRYVQTPSDVDSDDASNPVGQTFPDAVRDQLGLKLVPAKGPVTTYTLDHVEKPTPN